jgi:transposase-like protein
MKKGQKRTQYTKEQRTAHIEAFMACGKTVAEYARESGIKEHTLHNWVTGRGATKRPKVASVATRDDRFESNVRELKSMLLTHPNVLTTLAVLLVGIVSTGVNVAFAIANLVTWLRG